MKLNLPAFDIKIRRDSDGVVRVFDPLRAKYVALTPEEWVRQHFVNFLVEHRQYPATLMANEMSLRHNGCLRRCDTVVFDAYAHPIAVIEYKAATVPITEMVFDQVVRYNMVLGVKWIMVSNGLSHFCCYVQSQSPATYHFVKEIPPYSEL